MNCFSSILRTYSLSSLNIVFALYNYLAFMRELCWVYAVVLKVVDQRDLLVACNINSSIFTVNTKFRPFLVYSCGAEPYVLCLPRTRTRILFTS